MSFHKTGMHFVNVICSILAISLLFTSFLLDRKISYIDKIINDTPIKITSLILYILGCSYLFLIFSVGCIGTSSENGGLLFTYAITVLFLVLIQVSLACFTVFHADTMTQSAIIELKNHFIESMHAPKFDYRNPMVVFREVELRLKCCGLSSFTDYPVKPSGSCCGYQKLGFCTVENVYKTGCVPAMILYLHGITETTTVVCLVNGVLFIVSALYIGFFAEKLKMEERLNDRRIRPPLPIM